MLSPDKYSTVPHDLWSACCQLTMASATILWAMPASSKLA